MYKRQVIVNVITRKLFNYIIIWSEEIATSCFVYSVFIGAAYAYRKHQHVGVDLLVERLPAGARRVVHLITNALLVIINGYITVLSVQFIQSSWIKRMPITKLPSSVVSTALVIGFGLMFGGTGALIGGFDPFIQGDYSHLGLDIPLWVYIVFQTVFCATAATILSLIHISEPTRRS